MTARTGLVVGSALAVSLLGCGRSDLLAGLDDVAAESDDSGTASDGDGDPTGDGEASGDGEPVGDSDTMGDGDPTGDGDAMGDGDPMGDGDGDPTGACEPQLVELSPVQVPVIFLIDQGNHMGGNFDGLFRLQAIGVALFDPMQGVAWAWESLRSLGLVAFTSFDGDAGGECPILEVVAPDSVNGASMEASFSNLFPEDENPVADALTATVPLFAGEPGHVILLTGRNPDTCAAPNPQQGAADAVLAAQAAFAAGVQTHLVAVGNLNGTYAQSLANAGAGFDPQGVEAAPWAAPNSVATLVTALDGLLASVGTCELSLGTEVSAAGESECVVELDGEALIHGDGDGWSLLGADRLRLDGAACAGFEQGAVPALTCTCEAF